MTRPLFWVGASFLWLALHASAGCRQTAAVAPPAGAVQPTLVTDPVSDDPDDPAIWLDRQDPSRTLIIGTNKVAAPKGALVVFGLDGRTRQTVAGLDRPNNVDVEYDVTSGGRTFDIAVTTERLQHRLRVYRVASSAPHLTEIGTVPVLAGESGERAEPMGIALYRRPADAALFAIVAPKLGPATNYLWQYRIEDDGRGGIKGTLVRRFGAFSGLGSEPGEAGEIEAVVVDDVLGFVYYADERLGIRKWHADPDHPDADREVALFGRHGYQMDREGLAIYAAGEGDGFLVSTDQIPGGSTFKLYRRDGRPGAPDDHTTIVSEMVTTADSTDGIEVTSAALPGFPHGLLVAMNGVAKNFMIFRWEDVQPISRGDVGALN